MLFNTFKQDENKAVADSHLKEFQDSFMEKQKKIIIATLYEIAQSDGEYHEKEETFLNETAELLGFEPNDDLKEEVDEFLNLDPDHQAKILNSMTDKQIDWFIVTVVGMVHSDGASLDDEMRFTLQLLGKMGITQERFKEAIANSNLQIN